MSDKEFAKLEIGDIVRHVLGDRCYVVTGNYGGRVTAVRTVDLTHADEWKLIRKSAEAKSE